MSKYYKYVDIIQSLSYAFDLMDYNWSNHHQNVTQVALSIGKRLDLEDREMNNLLFASLIHDIGKHTYFDFKSPLLRNNHALKGYLVLRNFKPLEDVASIILNHHIKYNEKEDHRLPCYILSFADDFCMYMTDKNWVYEKRRLIANELLVKNENKYHPKIINLMNQLIDNDEFWLEIAYHKGWEDIRNNLTALKYIKDENTLLEFSKIISSLIDYRSTYTIGHSKSVSAIAKNIALELEFDSSLIQELEAAGLLHDIGKLAIPPDTMEKKNTLSDLEFIKMKAHPFLANKILSSISGFQFISTWVSQHHERLNGQGYPFGLDDSKLSLGSRILAASEFFVSLSEKRSYRDELSSLRVKSILSSQEKSGILDKVVIQVILDNFLEYQETIKKVYKEEMENYQNQLNIFETHINEDSKLSI